MKVTIVSILLTCFLPFSHGQFTSAKFGKGLINISAKDTSFTMKVGLRFQNLIIADFTEDSDGNFQDPDLNVLVRRSRLKFDGFAFSPKLKYKFELGLTNRDQSGGSTSDFSNSPRMILDAFIVYNFYKGFSIKFGQGKLPGNRERVISSGNLQFVDRSRLNSRFNIDRDVGITFLHKSKVGEVVLEQKVSISQGEGRNITSGNKGGLDYTFRTEILPFGSFASKGDYVNSAIKRESKPKLALGFTYDINDRASKSRGQNGTFIPLEDGFEGRTLSTVFVDLMFKYQGLSIMSEYANKKADGDNPFVIIDSEVYNFYTGSAFNMQAGYMFENNTELALRYTTVTPDEGVDREETRYTLGLSKYIVGHKLKVQSDVTYRDRVGGGNQIIGRVQMDLHF